MRLSKEFKNGSIVFSLGAGIGMLMMAFLIPKLPLSDPDSHCGKEKNELIADYDSKIDQVFPVIGAIFLALLVSALTTSLCPTEKKKRHGNKITTGASGRLAGAWREACESGCHQNDSDDAKAEY